MVETSNTFWQRIYSQNIKKMIGICFRYTSDKDVAEDLAHDAFLLAMEKVSGFEGRGPFEGWLRRIVVNVSLGYLRDQSKQKYLNDLFLTNEDSMETEEQSTSPDRYDFSTEELFEIINQLPEHHKLVFNLYVIDKFSHAQIARELSISEGTSKSHLARARKKIRALLIEKINSDKERKNHLLILFGFPLKLWNIDRLIYTQLDEFEIDNKHSLKLDSIPYKDVNLHAIKSTISSAGYKLTAFKISVFASIGMIALYYINMANGNLENHQDNISNNKIENSEKQNNLNSPATISENPILFNENISLTSNKDTMKKSEILAAMMLASAPMALPVKGQTTVKVATISSNDLKANANATVNISSDSRPNVSITTKVDPNLNVNVSTNSNINIDLNIDMTGTFYGENLFWSPENNALEFLGKSVVSFGDNSFVSSGKASFLDKVYYLVFEGKPVKLGANIKLTDKKYKLTSLSPKTATEKYGEVANKGAIEIELAE